ncbi:MAG: MurR/RpiR family transcriptional regulator [Actinomycetota bacterium]|nr:MurR/RpiR family transcriptional regulator [Actinomycetota bacterium]
MAARKNAARTGSGDDITQSPAGLLVRLRGLRPSLSPAEDRVAERVLADPRAAAALTISELAVQAQTSETTVLRFCKRLGLPGYPQLRLALAAESAQPRARVVADTDINEDDTVDDIIAKVAFTDASAVEETAQQLDRSSLTAAADAIAGASRVDIYGIGASAIVGTDAQQKLHRIGVVAFSWNDPHIALTSATLLRAGDVAIGISHSGTTRETIESLTTARGRGATTVAITNFPLSRLVDSADIVLTTAARETSLRSGATASRIAALTVVDCLYIAVAQRDLQRARQAVAETRQAVSAHHVEP